MTKKSKVIGRNSKGALADVVEALINEKNEESEIALREAIKLKSHDILHEQDEDMEDHESEDEDMDAEEECPEDEDTEEDEDEDMDAEEEDADVDEDEDEVTEAVKHHKLKGLGIKHKSGFKPFKRVGKK